ncbi:flavocytochrome c [Treponema socranskii subsp. paredis ATCC 35535]|nr:flavocytochrome c [Treponema socranskii subsp. paredis ATCC 35535]
MVTMKKMLLTGCAVLALCLAGCAGKNAVKDGDYAVSVTGHNGPIELTVNFSAKKISGITITKESETDVLSDPALIDLPKKIIETNSLAVDSVSGATVTSSAVKYAVRQAIAQAGGNPADFEKPIEKAPAKTENLSADVVVIGAGGAGVSAALRADQLGAKTVLLEKTGMIGGALVVSGGNQVVMGSKLQKEAGVANDSVQSMVADFMKNGARKNNEASLTLFARNVGAASDWLHEYAGVQFDMKGGLHKLAEYSNDRELAYLGGGSGFMKSILQKLSSTNIDLHLNTKATELKRDGSTVVGVIAEDSDGNTYDITAKSVVIATGGYGANKSLLSEDLQKSLYYGRSNATGDGLIMSDAVNAQRQLMQYGKRYPNGIEVAPGMAKSTIAGNIVAFNSGSAILINKEGKRVVSEKASNRTILETEVKQTDGMLFLFMDQKTFDMWKERLANAGISKENIDAWLKNNGSRAPIFIRGTTVEEAAAALNMDAAALKATIDTYNSYVVSGTDSAFGRPANFMKAKIEDGPYYLVEQKPRFATTMGGLVLDDSLQVIGTDGKIVSGLYAAGEVGGGVMGDDSPSGANNAWAITSGKLAGESAAKNASKK